MKRCSKCKEEKALVEFSWRSKSKNQLHGQCNNCRRETSRQSYDRNRDSIVNAVRLRNQEYKDLARVWKSKLSCVFCNENYIKCVEFHHMDKNKKDFNIAGMIAKYPLQSILKEVEKCIVVCSNCHRKIHGGAIDITNEVITKSRVMIHNSL